MPENLKKKRNHVDSKNVVCVVCFNKALKGRNISEKYQKILPKYITNFEGMKEFLPKVICPSCKIKIDKNKIINAVNYDEKNLIEIDECCDCDICIVARAKPGNFDSSFFL